MADVGTHEGVAFLVMEYLEGQTLEARLKEGPLPIADVLRYGIEIADALDRAHRSGIVHRDLKPGNVVLTKSGVVGPDADAARPRSRRAGVSRASDGRVLSFCVLQQAGKSDIWRVDLDNGNKATPLVH